MTTYPALTDIEIKWRASGSGICLIVEAMMQLRGLAGKNQVKDATIGMTQNIGGSGSNVVTHIFERSA